MKHLGPTWNLSHTFRTNLRFWLKRHVWTYPQKTLQPSLSFSSPFFLFKRFSSLCNSSMGSTSKSSIIGPLSSFFSFFLFSYFLWFFYTLVFAPNTLLPSSSSSSSSVCAQKAWSKWKMVVRKIRLLFRLG